MDVNTRNILLQKGKLDESGTFPHLDALQHAPRVFRTSFGLDTLPDQPGVIFIRGPRQYGKSTWLEQQLKDSVTRNGAGTAYYLNGDELRNSGDLARAVRELVPLFRPDKGPHRLFIDEVTAVEDWVHALKTVLDAGELRSVLVVTTGSKATDLRRGSERLPGRKGRLDRTNFLFTPVSFTEFNRVCAADLGSQTLTAYLLSGGCPIACGEIAVNGQLPEYVPTMIRDWILGESAAAGRPRSSLLAVMDVLQTRGATPIGQARLAREAGLANNTVAAGYIELLADLMCVGISHVWDASRRVRNRRKEAKFPFINLLAAVSFHRGAMRTPADFDRLPADQQGRWFEWLIAQELWRRNAVRGSEMPELVPHWRSKEHELDFVAGEHTYIEVKRGEASPLDFRWLARVLPKSRVVVVNRSSFNARQLRGLTFEQFLLDDNSDCAAE